MKTPKKNSRGKVNVVRQDRAAASPDVLDVSGPAETERVDPRWGWHYRTLLRLRAHLLREQGEQLANPAEGPGLHGVHMADTATDEFDEDLLLGRLSAEQDMLYEIEEAIHRLLDGTYGVCEKTGRPIAAARLRASPWTRFSQAAAQALERNKSIPAAPKVGNAGSAGKGVTFRVKEIAPPGEEAAVPKAADEVLRNKRAAQLEQQAADDWRGGARIKKSQRK